MKTKRTYSTSDVEGFQVSTVVAHLAGGCVVAVDVAKTKFVAALATAAGETVKLLRFEHPRQTASFLGVLTALREAQVETSVVMEPTGTYGDALRHQCHCIGVPVHMMPPKHTHDFAEIFDGVPSMHDPKAAVVLAKLHAVKPAPRWQPATEAQRDLRAWVDRRRPISQTLGVYRAHLEAMLARHWPEAEGVLDVQQTSSWLALVRVLPGPQAVADAGEQARDVLRKASRGQLRSERVTALIESARRTTGVPMTRGEEEKLRGIVEEIAVARARLERVDDELRRLVEQDEVLKRMASLVGPACAAAIGAHVGSPLSYPHTRAFEKALGLNLKEKSSGNIEGRLAITKRGPATARHLLFLAAVRTLKTEPIVTAWYRARTSYKAGVSMKAIVAVMRKLARALWHLARGATFDATKLFDVRRLDVGKPILIKTFDSSDAPFPVPAYEGGGARP